MNPKWQNALQKRLKAAGKVVVLGIGSPLKSDDAAGMLLIEALEQCPLDSERVLLIAGSSAPENFTGVIRDFAPDLLLAVDAAHLGLEPGALALVEGDELAGLEFSTHMLPFSVMQKYLASAGLQDILLLGIEPQSTEFGLTATAPVEEAVRYLAAFLAEQLQHK